MSTLPECMKCGSYVYHGKVLCEKCIEKITDELIKIKIERDEFKKALEKIKSIPGTREHPRHEVCQMSNIAVSILTNIS